MTGYYLATTGRPAWVGDDFRAAGYLTDDGMPDSIAEITKTSPSLLEVLHGAPHGSVTGYHRKSGRVHVEFDPAIEEMQQYEDVIAPMQTAAR